MKYLHSDIDTLERTEIIRDMRLDVFDVLVGINLLARRTGYSGDYTGGDSGCGQGRFPAFGDFADSDHWPCGKKQQKDMLSCMRIRLQIPCGWRLMRQSAAVRFSRNTMKSMELRRQTIKKSVRDLISISKEGCAEEMKLEKDPESMR